MNKQSSYAQRLEHAATRAYNAWMAYRTQHHTMMLSPDFGGDELRASMLIYHHYYKRMQRLSDAWRRAVNRVHSERARRAEKAASGPAAAYTYVETLQAPARPQRQLQRGRGHSHDWQPWGDDERYERCTVATCGATRLLEVKQGELF